LIYSNLLYLFVVILIISTRSVDAVPRFPFSLALPLFLIKGLLFYFMVRHLYQRRRIVSAPQYFSAEQKYSIAAVLSFATDVYLLDCLHYFSLLPLASRLPVLVSLAGTALFLSYMAMIWAAERKSYLNIFDGHHSPLAFIIYNLRNMIALLLPWLILSFFSDLLQALRIPILTRLFASPWGEPLVFTLFFLFLLFFFPVLATRLWGCTPLPAGVLRSEMERFCRRQHLKYKDILLWPLFEGRVLTAAVIGFVRSFRYLLITPAMLAALTTDEIEAVMAHEIAHVKRYHMQLYLFLFLGFGLAAQLSTMPLYYLLFSSDAIYKISGLTGRGPNAVFAFLTTFAMLLTIILYFRYVFGFFMRNFERQADLHALATTGHSGPLVNVFEKIALLSGNIRDQPSWHHFSLAQRISFLLKCDRNPRLIGRHHRKVYMLLGLYFLFLLAGATSLWKVDEMFRDVPGSEKVAEFIIRSKIQDEPANPIWHLYLGDLEYAKRNFAAARKAYEHVLLLAPDQPDALNNLAWLLLTADDPAQRDPARALVLAERAVRIKEAPPNLDTLAEAYWANNMPTAAIEAERKALAQNPANHRYYQQQLEKFKAQSDNE